MFQGITQGASISILYRNEPRIVTGKVVSANTHVPAFNPNQPMNMFNGLVTDLTVQVGNETIPFVGLPANGVVANFPDKGIFLAEDSAAIFREVDNAVTTIEQDLATVPAKQKMLEGYKRIRQESNPEAKRDAQREKEMSDLRGELSEMRRMLSEFLGAKSKEE